MSGVLVGWVVPTIHVLACLFLIAVVLLQTGKGADMGAVFGGGSQTLFGSGGAGNFLTRLTTGTAIAFMVTSLILTYGQSRQPTSRLLDRLPAPGAEAPAPAGDLPMPGTEGGLPAAGEPTADAGGAAAPAAEAQADAGGTAGQPAGTAPTPPATGGAAPATPAPAPTPKRAPAPKPSPAPKRAPAP